MNAPDSIEANQHHFLQIWILLISIILFGLYVAWDLNYFALILDLDRSYMAPLTMALVMAATAHCGWHIAHFSSHTAQLQSWLNDDISHAAGNPLFLQAYLQDLDTLYSPHSQQSPDDNIVDIHAERIRSPVDLGWFFVDLAVRLGLLGTIIGFILIFASLTDINIEGGDDLKELLIAMSGGMGTALLTTLTGLIGASILSFQYLILGRETEYLVGLLLRVKNHHLAGAGNTIGSSVAEGNPTLSGRGEPPTATGQAVS
jgi:hypothetical protein